MLPMTNANFQWIIGNWNWQHFPIGNILMIHLYWKEMIRPLFKQ